MKHELVRWLCIELNIGMVMGSNLGWTKLGFLFVNFSFGMKVKGQGNPSPLRGLENHHRIAKWQLNSSLMVFSFYTIYLSLRPELVTNQEKERVF